MLPIVLLIVYLVGIPIAFGAISNWMDLSDNEKGRFIVLGYMSCLWHIIFVMALVNRLYRLLRKYNPFAKLNHLGWTLKDYLFPPPNPEGSPYVKKNDP